MPIKSKDLHGNVPDSSGAALLLIDVVNDFEFEGGEALIDLAMPVGKQIANLKKRAKKAGIPAIYVNDNFGKWQSDLNKIVSHCLEDGVRGEPFVKLVLPDEDDYFVLKPKHSGFYCTSLELLLEHCSVSQTQEENEYALKQMQKVLKADISPWAELNLEELKKSKTHTAQCEDGTDNKFKEAAR